MEATLADTTPIPTQQKKEKKGVFDALTDMPQAQVKKDEDPLSNFAQNAVTGFKAGFKTEYKPIDIKKVDFSKLATIGLALKDLSKKTLDALLNYQKSDAVVVTTTFVNKETGECKEVQTAGKLKLQKADPKNPDSEYEVGVDMRFINNQPALISDQEGNKIANPAFKQNFEKPFMGHNFTEKQIMNMQKNGNAGDVINLTFKNGNMHPCLVGWDHELNKIIPAIAAHVHVPSEICKVKLSEKQQNALKKGASLVIKNFQTKEGKRFMSNISYSPAAGRFVFSEVSADTIQAMKMYAANKAAVEHIQAKTASKIEKDEHGVPFVLYKGSQNEMQLDEAMRAKMRIPEGAETGSSLKLENLKNKDGETYTTYVRLDKSNKNGISFSADGTFTKKKLAVELGQAQQEAANVNGHKTPEMQQKGVEKLEKGQTRPTPQQKPGRVIPKKAGLGM